VTAHNYADLFDDELVNIAAALDVSTTFSPAPHSSQAGGPIASSASLAPSRDNS
jgi:hypothetical protein